MKWKPWAIFRKLPQDHTVVTEVIAPFPPGANPPSPPSGIAYIDYSKQIFYHDGSYPEIVTTTEGSLTIPDASKSPRKLLP